MYLKLIWLSSTLFALFNFIGLLMPIKEPKKHKTKWLSVVFCIVSYGKNSEAIKRTIQAIKKYAGNLNYEIEVITDIALSEQMAGVKYLVVPNDYQTSKKAKYKARALHYGIEKRLAHQDKWVLHLDEESQVKQDTIRGIKEFAKKHKSENVIGQGAIYYNAYNYGQNALITAIDSVRTGDDLGRFRTQYKLFKRPIFGLHGSFFFLNSVLEQAIGFDLGGKGSLTEDAYFALKAMDMGIKFDWINGGLYEQSPYTLRDLIKQRRRWFNGLSITACDNVISLRSRSCLLLSICLWSLLPFSILASVFNLILPTDTPLWLSIISGFNLAVIVSVYLVGAKKNGGSLIKTLLLFVPSACIEAYAIIYAIVRPVSGFQVVNKN